MITNYDEFHMSLWFMVTFDHFYDFTFGYEITLNIIL